MPLSDEELKVGLKVKCIYQGIPKCFGKTGTIKKVLLNSSNKLLDLTIDWDDKNLNETAPIWGMASSFEAIDMDGVNRLMELLGMPEPTENKDTTFSEDDLQKDIRAAVETAKKVLTKVDASDIPVAVQRACSMCMRPNNIESKICWCCLNPPFLTRE